MPDSDVYRKHAEECREQAALAINPDQKRQYQLIAEAWMKLALSAERRERGDIQHEE
jgi:hypothetical protein